MTLICVAALIAFGALGYSLCVISGRMSRLEEMEERKEWTLPR